MYEALLEGELPTRFLQTNFYLEFGWQFQHNKIAIIDESMVFCGAGNFTAAAFRDNYENFYIIESSAFTDAYLAEFDRLFALAKVAEDLPADPVY
jgi:phosphatidylserine/phosphatidylglycerophosphate/cardiolipin synthase-like enzyme